ncbi:sigma 54-interacting transcriptional regulator [Myxococcota bacterium]|nr:sigma 54-interacting transcriptional regulator [Myxococcota bacterium]
MPRRLELDLWQTVSRHLDVVEALEKLGPRLTLDTGAAFLSIRLFDLERERLDTLAQFGAAEQRAQAPHVPLDHETLGRLVTWARTGEVVRSAKRADHPVLGPLSQQAPRGAAAAVPLSKSHEDPAGALLLVGPAALLLSEASAAVLEALAEPLSVALANDRRLHRLMQATEATEADKRALLSRLDRQDISDSVVGAEAGLRDVMEKVQQVAHTDAPVLILGETGAGKEVVARAIHSQSKRAAGPMLRVNCGAIPSELVDSELFGHEQGSFTGATNRRKGWFERADGGTLFLDEIGELPLAAQVRLLRVVQDNVIDRVGAQRSTPVDVRIVAATHRDLEQMVAEGSFREDLWYRISVFPIRLPPLRERPEDIPTLAAHFARRAGKRLGGMPLSLSADDISMLVAYDWPGNVRELAAVIERAAILGGGMRLELASALGLPMRGLGPARPAPRAAPPHSTPPRPGRDVAPVPHPTAPGDTLDRAMIQHIEAALTRSLGRIDGPFGAATALGINPHTLRARMRKLGIDWRRFRGA